MPQKSSKVAKTKAAPKPKKEKKVKEIPEDHSNYKIEIWEGKDRRIFTLDWEGHMVDKDTSES